MKRAISRRQMLGRLAAALPLLATAPSLFSAQKTARKRLGVCGYSYSLHWKAARDGELKVPFKDAIEFIEYCHRLGAGGAQVAIGSKEPGYAAKVRAKIEAHQMYLEGQVNLPKNESDVE